MNDWQVCGFNGEIDYGNEIIPGGARFGVGGGTSEFTKGTTWCLDVLAAIKDSNRNLPAKNHWTLLDAAAEVRPYCCPTASLIEIDANGQTASHQWFMISGQDANGEQTGTVESIDFADAAPRWQTVGSILQPLATTKAVLLPDGTVFFAGENREALVRPDDPSFPLMTSYAGLVPSVVAVHSRVRQSPNDRGAALVHIFRFEGDRIAELWDIGQPLPAASVNANGMF